MKILGIESASVTASAALVDGDHVLAEFTTNYQKTHSETLLPMIDEIVRMTDTELSTLDGIAVSAGPGSFTGLRIGAATGKGLAFALEKPMIAVPTLAAIAYGAFGSSYLLCPLMDARRGEVYTGLFRFDGETLVTVQESTAVPLTEEVRIAEETARALSKEILYLGDGVAVFEAKIREISTLPPHFAPAPVRFQRGVSVAALGERMLAVGQGVSAAEFSPIYLRKSQAEREREEAGLSIAADTDYPTLDPVNKIQELGENQR